MSSIAQAFQVALLAGCSLPASSPPAQGPSPRTGDLAVREVSVFKDGHAFVLREGTPTPDAQGRIVLDRLPEPVLGTFWPYAEGAELVSVTAARERVASEETALDLKQLLRANAGKEVALFDVGGERIEGRLVGLTRREADEVERLEPSGGRPRLPVEGSLVLVATTTGTRALPIERVRDVEIQGELAARVRGEVLEERLTLRLEGANGPTRVGVAYVQRGLRWIPAYRIELDGAGRAAVRLEATLVNDLIDLEDATVHLVIGAPRFEFAGQVDPIALREVAVELAAGVQAGDRFRSLSNAMMTQAALSYVQEDPAASAAPEVGGGESNEDLFVFSVRHVTLGRGERMVLPLWVGELPYRDVHVLEVPFAPPPEIRQQFAGHEATELERMLAAPKVIHTLRITNGSSAPLTTAPALVLSRGQVLAQGLVTYTPVGAATDVAINPAVDVRLEITEEQVGQIPDAMKWHGDSYARTDIAGSIVLTNSKREAIEVEVERRVLGLVDEAGQEGVAQQDGLSELAWDDLPGWWAWYSWPWWWYRWNGLGRFTWSAHLEPGQELELAAKWHYFWR